MSNLRNINNNLAQLKEAYDKSTQGDWEASLNFIAMAHKNVPGLLEEFDRLQCLETELNDVKHQVIQMRETLQSSRRTKQTLQRELKQMEKHSAFFLSTLTS